MKKLFLILLLFPITLIAQDVVSVKHYICKNGYKVNRGDTLMLIKPETDMYQSLYKDKTFGKNEYLNSTNSVSYIVANKISRFFSGTDKEYALIKVYGDGIKNYVLDIEKAIELKEISVPNDYTPHPRPINNSESYKASNGITYKVGDLIELGKGSNSDGSFVHLRVSGWAGVIGADTRIGAGYAGNKVIIKSFLYERSKRRGFEKVWVMVGGGNITNYSLDLESAIQVCEVVPCSDVQKVQIINKPLSIADELKKLHNLKEEGILSEEEYNQQKQKLLNQE